MTSLKIRSHVTTTIKEAAFGYRNISRVVVILLMVAGVATPLIGLHAASSAPTVTVDSAAACLGVSSSGYQAVYVYINFTNSGFNNDLYTKGWANVTVTLDTQVTRTGQVISPGSTTENLVWTFTGLLYNGFSGGANNCSAPTGTIANNPIPSGSYTFYNQNGSMNYAESYTIDEYTVQVSACTDPSFSNCPYSSPMYTGFGTGVDPNPTFQSIVQLPLFNDPMLGTSTSCDPAFSPCYVPIATYYNFIAIIAIIVAAIGGLIAFGTSTLGNSKESKGKNFAFDIGMTVIFIVAFPYIYNNVANLLNYLNASIIAGPGNSYTAYSSAINDVWGASLGGGSSPSLWSLISAAGNLWQLVAFFIDFFVYIATYVLGVIRMWLVVVMIVAFPLGLALKHIPFAEKLSGMIEDTFYGLVMATIMSAIILGVAASLFPGGSPALNGTVFGSGEAPFVAAMALLTALLMPTVLAPLTSTLFQTGMQMSIAAGSMAAMVGATAATGGASGVAGAFGGGGGMMGGGMMGIGNALASAGSAAGGSAGSGATGSLGGIAGATGFTLSPAQKAMHIGKAALPHIGKNIGLGVGAGLLASFGATAAAKHLNRLQTPAHEIQANVAQSVAAHQAALDMQHGEYGVDMVELGQREFLNNPLAHVGEINSKGVSFGTKSALFIQFMALKNAKGAKSSYDLTGARMTPGALKTFGEKYDKSMNRFVKNVGNADWQRAHGFDIFNQPLVDHVQKLAGDAKLDKSTEELVIAHNNGHPDAAKALDARAKLGACKASIDYDQHMNVQ
jgi:hypothetical protein